MSQHHTITDTSDRKLEVGIDETGAVFVTKKWLDADKGWLVRELIINGDEWDRINDLRER